MVQLPTCASLSELYILRHINNVIHGSCMEDSAIDSLFLRVGEDSNYDVKDI